MSLSYTGSGNAFGGGGCGGGGRLPSVVRGPQGLAGPGNSNAGTPGALLGLAGTLPGKGALLGLAGALPGLMRTGVSFALGPLSLPGSSLLCFSGLGSLEC